MSKKQPGLRADELRPLKRPLSVKSSPVRNGTVESTGKGRKFVPKRGEKLVRYTEKGERVVSYRKLSPQRAVVWQGKTYYVNAAVAGE